MKFTIIIIITIIILSIIIYIHTNQHIHTDLEHGSIGDVLRDQQCVSLSEGLAASDGQGQGSVPHGLEVHAPCGLQHPLSGLAAEESGQLALTHAERVAKMEWGLYMVIK